MSGIELQEGDWCFIIKDPELGQILVTPAAQIYAQRSRALKPLPAFRRARANAEFIAAEVAAGRLVPVKIVDDAGWTITEFQKAKGNKHV